MKAKEIRIGNLVMDATNYNYEVCVGIDELRCCNIFAPVPLKEKHLKSFKKEVILDKVVLFKDGNDSIVSVAPKDDGWSLTIHTPFAKYYGIIHYVHELQNIMVDCGLDWGL